MRFGSTETGCLRSAIGAVSESPADRSPGAIQAPGLHAVQVGKQPDPRLRTYSWVKIRRYWQQRKAQPCARCGGQIDYSTYRIPVGNGRYRINPAGLHVGHKLARVLDRRTTWAIQDTQPEHVRCSTTAGVRLGNALHGKGTRGVDQSRKW